VSRALTVSTTFAALCLTGGGCDGDRTSASEDAGPRVAIAVAPLSLAGVTDAEYTLRVSNGPNGTGDTVWTEAVSAQRHGDGAGSIAYVGPCDASTGVNTVTLTLTALRDASGLVPVTSYMNPTPLSREVACVANADVSVTFDITVARRAEQGFFDVAVELDDVFCSAKLDCVRSGGAQDLELLHNPLDGGARDLTAVLGFACTGGPGADTWLYMNDLSVACAGPPASSFTLDPGGLGNLDLGAALSSNPSDYLFAAAVYRGEEQLAGKAYWNIALGLNEAAFASVGACTLTARATASSEAFAQTEAGFVIPEGAVYPVVDWTVPLSDGAGRVCTAHEVGDVGRVEVGYVGYLAAPNQLTWASAPIAFKYRYHRGGVVETATPAGPATWDAATWDTSVWAP